MTGREAGSIPRPVGLWMKTKHKSMFRSKCGCERHARRVSKRSLKWALAYNPDLAEVRGRDNHIYGGESTTLSYGAEPRLTAIRLVDSFWFDQLILLAIGVNCVTMAMESPMDPEGTRKAHIIDVVGWVLLSSLPSSASSKY